MDSFPGLICFVGSFVQLSDSSMESVSDIWSGSADVCPVCLAGLAYVSECSSVVVRRVRN